MSIEDTAVDHFGLTKNIFEAGWILRDGRMLDFSGRKFGSASPSVRYMDHREVGVVFPEEYKHTERDGYLDPVTDFERETGALRISVQGEAHKTGRPPDDPGFPCDYNLQVNTDHKVTVPQKRTLAMIHRRCPQNWVDVYFKNGNLCDASSSLRLTDAWRALERCRVQEKS